MNIFLRNIHHISQKMSGNRPRQIAVTETEISHGQHQLIMVISKASDHLLTV